MHDNLVHEQCSGISDSTLKPCSQAGFDLLGICNLAHEQGFTICFPRSRILWFRFMAPKKKKRLSSASGNSYISQSALSEVLDTVRQSPEILKEGTSRWSIKRKRESEVDIETYHGKLLQQINLELNDGSMFQSWVVHPLCLLEHLTTISPRFNSFMKERMERYPGCWRVALYADEVKPGNVLRSASQRMCWGIYWSFCEYEFALQDDMKWFTVMVITSEELKEVKDRLSQVFREIVRLFTNCFNGVFLSQVGRVLEARIHVCIADEAALKSIYQNKGASGSKICLKCRNVVGHSARHRLVNLFFCDKTIYV